ncbi:MAG TPA: hypothetical protein VFV31_04090 [Chitinophagaceae bacterium]|nr:hypothetical protein [Chitinophagaceae bacterium]
MLNPYTLLTPEILGAMLKQPMYFVRQYYERGKDIFDEPTIPLLLTHYGHHETDRERADRHMRLVWKDPYRFLYDSKNPAHPEKLTTAALQPHGYRVYINLLPAKWKAGDTLKMKISRYVRERLPWWNYSPADKLNVTLKERYGQLFIALLWRGQQTEVLLDDIENGSLCATT